MDYKLIFLVLGSRFGFKKIYLAHVILFKLQHACYLYVYIFVMLWYYLIVEYASLHSPFHDWYIIHL